MRTIMPSPDDPEPIAEEEAPKPDLPPPFGLGSNEPGGHDRHHHGGPLKLVQIVHSFDSITLVTLSLALSQPEGDGQAALLLSGNEAEYPCCLFILKIFPRPAIVAGFQHF